MVLSVHSRNRKDTRALRALYAKTTATVHTRRSRAEANSRTSKPELAERSWIQDRDTQIKAQQPIRVIAVTLGFVVWELFRLKPGYTRRGPRCKFGVRKILGAKNGQNLHCKFGASASLKGHFWLKLTLQVWCNCMFFLPHRPKTYTHRKLTVKV